MPQSHTEIRNLIEDILEDGNNVTYSTAKIDLQIEKELSEISRYDPYRGKWTLEIEGRIGTASSTTSNALVDATKSQFVSGDTEKIIYNTTDKTWAVVTTFVGSSQLTLSKDIMTSGKNYEMYNKNCWNQRQINIEDLKDWIEIDYAEYPTPHHSFPYIASYPPHKRNVTILDNRRVLEIDVIFIDDTGRTDPDKEVYVHTLERHRLNPMTDLAGASESGGAIGATSMSVDNLTDSDIVKEGELFTIAGVRGIYRVVSDVTVASSKATVVFFPGLIDTVTAADVVTFVKSTLDSELEGILADLVAGRLIVSKSNTHLNKIPKGGRGTVELMQSTGYRLINEALFRLNQRAEISEYEEYSRA